MVDAEGLEHAPEAVTQMQAEQDHGEDVPGGDVPDLEAAYGVGINISFLEATARVYHTCGEMKDVIDDEGEQDGSAPVHGAGGIAGYGVLTFGVSDGAGLGFAKGQSNGSPDMQPNSGEQANADHPQEFRNAVQKMAVAVELVGSSVDLHVAQHVPDDKGEQDKAGRAHDDFLAVSGLPEANRTNLTRADYSCSHFAFLSIFLRAQRATSLRFAQQARRLAFVL